AGVRHEARGTRKAANRGDPLAPRALDLAPALLHADLAAGRGGFLGQAQLEHALRIFRLGLRLVDFLRQREAARGLAEVALDAQPLVAFLRLAAPGLGRNRHFVA